MEEPIVTCEEMKDLLPLFAGGEVEENERVAVEAHLSLCAECSRELREYKEVRGYLSELRDGPLPTGTAESVWNGVRAELFPRRRTSIGLDWAIRSAAVLVIGLAIGFGTVAFSRPSVAPEKKDRALTKEGGSFGGTASISHSGADFIGGSSTLLPWIDSTGPLRSLPRVSRPEGLHYLPKVDTVLMSGEREF